MDRKSSLSLSRQPFLETNDLDRNKDESQIESLNEDCIQSYIQHQRQSRFCNLSFPLLFHILLILTYTSSFAYLTRKSWNPTSSKSDTYYSPAESAIAYMTKTVDGLATDSIFAGDPSPELDHAWHNLLTNINLRLSTEEMQRLNQTSLELSNGSGYLGTLGVYHELHCLKRTRKWIYRDYYYPNITRLEHLEHEKHVEHCLELLRQAVICKGDVSVTPFKWLGNTLEPTTKEGILHRCVDWDRLAGWAHERAVDLFDPNLLVKPSSQEWRVKITQKIRHEIIYFSVELTWNERNCNV